MSAVVSRFLHLDGEAPQKSDWSITRTWSLSWRLKATLTVDLEKMVLELTPDPRPRRWKMTASEIDAYQAVEHEMLAELASKIGGSVGSILIKR